MCCYGVRGKFVYKLSDTDCMHDTNSYRILGQKYRLPSPKCGRSAHESCRSLHIKEVCVGVLTSLAIYATACFSLNTRSKVNQKNIVMVKILAV